MVRIQAQDWRGCHVYIEHGQDSRYPGKMTMAGILMAHEHFMIPAAMLSGAPERHFLHKHKDEYRSVDCGAKQPEECGLGDTKSNGLGIWHCPKDRYMADQ